MRTLKNKISLNKVYKKELTSKAIKAPEIGMEEIDSVLTYGAPLDSIRFKDSCEIPEDVEPELLLSGLKRIYKNLVIIIDSNHMVYLFK